MNGKNTTPQATRLYLWLGALLLVALSALPVNGARADATADKKRATMAGIRRIAIVAPIFSLSRLTKPEAPPERTGSALDDRTTEDTQASRETRVADYRDQLRKIADHAYVYLTDRMKTRTPYEIVPTGATERALKALELTPEKLFAEKAQTRGGRLPQPDPEATRRLAASLHADAVLLTMLDEPRRTNGHFTFNPLTGIDYTSSHVGAHGVFSMMLADGKEALSESISVLHPLTHVGKREYVLVDWQEAHDLLIEDMLDDLTRYTPEKPEKKAGAK